VLGALALVAAIASTSFAVYLQISLALCDSGPEFVNHKGPALCVNDRKIIIFKWGNYLAHLFGYFSRLSL
jgi:hypothetical protein